MDSSDCAQFKMFGLLYLMVVGADRAAGLRQGDSEPDVTANIKHPGLFDGGHPAFGRKWGHFVGEQGALCPRIRSAGERRSGESRDCRTPGIGGMRKRCDSRRISAYRGAAEYLDRLVKKLNLPPVAVYHFEIDGATVYSRLGARRNCPVCGRIYNLVTQPPADLDFCDDDGMILVARKDDDPTVIRARMHTFNVQTAPVLRHYRSHLHRIDAARTPEIVLGEIESRLRMAAPSVSCLDRATACE